MYTRCPQCKVVHPLTAELLSHARGLVQCGECGRTFSALSFLFDDWPEGEAQGPAQGPDAAPPVLEKAETPQTDAEADASSTEETSGNRQEMAWKVGTVILLLLTIANITWTFRAPLMAIPAVQSWLAGADDVTIEEHGLLKDPEQIQLVSRDMHTHPTRSGILVLSLTFVNLAQRNQLYPDLELTLLDAANQAVARRVLKPADYLRPDADISAGLATDVYLPVLLELGDPGAQAVGFEIQFL